MSSYLVFECTQLVPNPDTIFGNVFPVLGVKVLGNISFFADLIHC